MGFRITHLLASCTRLAETSTDAVEFTFLLVLSLFIASLGMFSRYTVSALVAFSFFYDASFASAGATKAQYLGNAINTTDVLNQQWYNEGKGTWQDFWWNSGSMLATIGNLAQQDSDFAGTAEEMFANILVKAKTTNGGSFLNDYYDDEGWWAMGWIKAYDLTQNTTYLDAAKEIFNDLLTGNNATCGGHWWSKDKRDNTAIANELYLAVAASLANRVTDAGDYYRNLATTQAQWFFNSGLLNDNNTINDSLDLTTCKPQGTVWTYNQGVILSALIELHSFATTNGTYLDLAGTIAHAAIQQLSVNGTLTESGYPADMDPTGAQFKGVFARSLMALHAVAPDGAYVDFLQANADSIWAHARGGNGQIGALWQGPIRDTSAAAQSSALDCLVAAAAVTTE